MRKTSGKPVFCSRRSAAYFICASFLILSISVFANASHEGHGVMVLVGGREESTASRDASDSPDTAEPESDAGGEAEDKEVRYDAEEDHGEDETRGEDEGGTEGSTEGSGEKEDGAENSGINESAAHSGSTASSSVSESNAVSSLSESAVSSAESVAEELPSGKAASRLTGLPVSEETVNRRPAAILFDNVKDADPPSNLSGADVFIEFETEGGQSRICALYEDYADLAKIGPLKSCSDYFLSVAAGYDEIFCHFGQTAYSLPYLESDNVDNLSGYMPYSAEAFFRDGPHASPHDAYISGSGISRLIGELNYRAEYRDDFEPQLQFAEKGQPSSAAGGNEAACVKTGYRDADPTFLYNEEDGLYYRQQYGRAHMDNVTGSQLSVKNILLEYQSAAEYQDTEYLHYHPWGEGRGKYISDGRAIDITWSRKDFYSRAEYRTAGGEPLVLTPGKTWIAVIRRDSLRECLIGSSEEDLACVADSAAVKDEEEKNEEWVAKYRSVEKTYLEGLAQKRNDLLAQHGGVSKVEAEFS